MNSSEVAEEFVKLSLEGMEVAARITGEGAKQAAVLLYTLSQQQKATKGKTKLNNMLRSGRNLSIFSIKEDQLESFNVQAKQYGVMYSALIDKKHPSPDGTVDIMVMSDDAPKVNRIIDKFKYTAFDIAEIRKEIQKEQEEAENIPEKGVETKSSEERIVEDALKKPIQKDGSDVSNPTVAKVEKNPLSEPSSKTRSTGVVSDKKKPSVREDLERIKKELKDKEVSEEEVKEISSQNKSVPINDDLTITNNMNNNKNLKSMKERNIKNDR